MTTTENARLCSYCGEMRDPSWFRPQKGKCRACLTSYMRSWRQQLAGDAKEKFLEYKRTWDRAHPRDAEQKAKNAAYMKARRAIYTEEERKAERIRYRTWRRESGYERAYKESHREQYRQKEFRRNLARNYNLTPDEYHKIAENQNGVCAICSRPHSDHRKRRLYVDHDHGTGKVRGLLCSRCNSVIGFCRDDESILLSAVDYLRRHRT